MNKLFDYWLLVKSGGVFSSCGDVSPATPVVTGFTSSSPQCGVTRYASASPHFVPGHEPRSPPVWNISDLLSTELFPLLSSARTPAQPFLIRSLIYDVNMCSTILKIYTLQSSRSPALEYQTFSPFPCTLAETRYFSIIHNFKPDFV